MKCVLKRNLTIFLSFLAFALCAQIPAGYYNNAEGKKQAALKTALCAIIRPHTVFSYGGTSTWSCFAKTDVDANGKCWDMYSTTRNSFNAGNTSISGMNIEHSVANSWWGHTTNDAYKDIHHLNPSDATANSRKSNYPMGYVTTVTYTNGVTKVGTGTPDGLTTSMKLFEPADEYKGDFAREFMYVITCYEEMATANMWVSTGLTALSNTTYPTMLDWYSKLLLKWNREDTVSQKEIDRNNAIYSLQHNRNPFIDHPELAEYIWGNKQDVVWYVATGIDTQTINELATYPNPAKERLFVRAESTETAIYTIYNICGQPIQNGKFDAENSIALDGIPNGYYILKVEMDNKLYVAKFIVSK